MTNAEIAKLLRNVAAAYTIKNESKFRFQIIAYQRAADAIESSTLEVKDLVKEKKIESLPGVGPSIRAHLEELIKKGQVKHFDWVFKGVPASVFPLLDVPSLGPKKAFRLVQEFSLNKEKTVLEDLEKVAKAGKIAGLEGFGEKSQADILRAISEFKQGSGKATRMVLPYAAELAEKIIEYLKKSKSIVKAEALGSLRRMKSTIGDIDIAVAAIEPKDAVGYFIHYPYLERVIEKGDVSASILTSGGKQIDLIVLPGQQFGSLLQHFTGSKDHNVRLREYALKKGMSLSERGIKKKMENGKWKIENYATEEKFYKALGMDWIPPEIRENTGEVELALAHKLPSLVELKDIKGDLHIHSSFAIEPSHDMGKDTMENMLERAKELKYEYLGFSEHNPSTSKHTKQQIYDILKRKKEKIEQLNSSNKYVRALNLLEVDILSSGDLSIDNKAAEYLDGMLVSIHSVFNMNKTTMTNRVLKGLSHPKAKILTHPTGRLINERPGYELDFEKIFDFCKKNNKALEVNSQASNSTARLDLPDNLVRKAVENGVKLVINTDSHALEGMNLMKYGVSVARRGWAKKDDIVNTMPYNSFVSWLKS